MIDDELGRGERFDPLGIPAELLDGLTHRGQIDHDGHSREVLHHDARGRELDLLRGLGCRIPGAQCGDGVCRDVRAIFGAQQVLEKDLVREGQAV